MSTLKDVSIIVTTFLRDGYLAECVYGIHKYLPEVTTIIVDDGNDGRVNVSKREYYDRLMMNTKTHVGLLPYDSGLPAKRNAAAKLAQTPYVLLGCDDFEFDAPAREGIEKFVAVLDAYPDVDVVVGRFGHQPYEGHFEFGSDYIKEHRLDTATEKPLHAEPIPVWKIDIGVNYFLARTQVLLDVPWDEGMKIGGEHGDWFMDLKTAGKTVVYVEGPNINHQPSDASKQDPRYPAMRARCWDGHNYMMAKRGIKEYRGFGDE